MKYNTIFLDRDGVINKKIMSGYVTNIKEFIFIPKSLEALATLAKLFPHIFIATNQQGVNKGLFSWEDLQNIHDFMIHKIVQYGGRIDKIYVSTDLESENSIHRKPEPGMAWQAKKDYPDLDFKRSIMVGDSMSDIQFGKNVGMTTVLITNEIIENKINADFCYKDLYDFSMKGLKIFDNNNY
jgi:histidinol-phosphate phosphatase family protein